MPLGIAPTAAGGQVLLRAGATPAGARPNAAHVTLIPEPMWSSGHSGHKSRWTPWPEVTRIGGRCFFGSHQPRSNKQLFIEKGYPDCRTVLQFAGSEDATCLKCGLRMYLTASGQVGSYPSAGWRQAASMAAEVMTETQDAALTKGGQCRTDRCRVRLTQVASSSPAPMFAVPTAMSLTTWVSTLSMYGA